MAQSHISSPPTPELARNQKSPQDYIRAALLLTSVVLVGALYRIKMWWSGILPALTQSCLHSPWGFDYTHSERFFTDIMGQLSHCLVSSAKHLEHRHWAGLYSSPIYYLHTPATTTFPLQSYVTQACGIVLRELQRYVISCFFIQLSGTMPDLSWLLLAYEVHPTAALFLSWVNITHWLIFIHIWRSKKFHNTK